VRGRHRSGAGAADDLTSGFWAVPASATVADPVPDRDAFADADAFPDAHRGAADLTMA
jgi:hypothetical protein